MAKIKNWVKIKQAQIDIERALKYGGKITQQQIDIAFTAPIVISGIIKRSNWPRYRFINGGYI